MIFFFLFMFTMAVLAVCTVIIFNIANPKTDREIWTITGCLLAINAVSYWMGIYLG